MRKLVVLSGLLLSVLLASAQVDSKAKSILDEVTSKTKSYKTIQAEFDYIMENKEMDIHENYRGKITMKGDQYFLNLKDLGLEIYCDGSNVSTYMIDSEELTIAPMDAESGEVMNPSQLFTIYEEGFSYKFIEEKVIEGENTYVIDLFPQDDSIEYSRVRIFINKDKMMIRKAEMYAQEGSTYIVKISDLKTNSEVPASTFKFDQASHPGVDVIDLR